YDYWQDKIRRSILLDATADILLYGNAERAIVDVAHRLARGETIETLTDIRGTAFIRQDTPDGWMEIDSTRVDRPGKVDRIVNPYVNWQEMDACEMEKRNTPLDGVQYNEQGEQVVQSLPHPKRVRDRTVIRLPAFEKVRNNAVLYAHASR